MNLFTHMILRIALALIICSGCTAGRQEVKSLAGLDEAKPEVVRNKKRPMAEYLIPQIEEKKQVRPRPEEKFTVAVQEANIKDVLMVLARDSRYNIIVDPEVSSSITVDLKGVTMEDALHAILLPLHLEYRIRGNTIHVLKPKVETRIFTLNYITASRTGETMLSASSGGKGGEGSQSSGAYGTVKTESKVSLWDEIRQGLKAILFGSDEQGGSSNGGQRLVINEVSGTILVTDFPDTLLEVANFLETVEGSIQRQVMISAKIMEVSLSDTFKMGIDWAGFPNLRGAYDGTLTTGLAAAQPLPASVVQNLSPNTGIFQFGATKGDLSVLLDMIATQGDIHVLSSPKISTLNNQKAIIKAAREDSFFTIQKEVNTEGGVLQENFSVERNDYTIGVVLDVTPQISNNGEIIMNIHPSITEFVGEKTFPPGATGSDILANAPILDVREVDTMVRVRNGETVVIGGLMKEKKHNTVVEVPFLSKIPILGWLFKRIERETENIELVILLTPEVVIGRSMDEVPHTALGLSLP